MNREQKLVLVAVLTFMGLSMMTPERRAQRIDGRRPRDIERAPVAHRDTETREPDGDARGRDAKSPSESPARGWWNIAKRVARQFGDHRIMTEAAGITFYALLALFPALAALISLYGLFADPNTISEHLSAMSGVIPGGGMDLITEQVRSLASNSGNALGFGVVVGLATSLWTANQGIKGLFDALNVVYDEHEKRSYLLRTALSLAFTAGTLVFLLIAMAAVVALPIVLDFIGLGWIVELLLRLLRWPLLLVVVTVFFAFVYRYGPSHATAKWRWVSWAGRSPPCSGSSGRPASRGTSRISAATTRHTARWARSSGS